MTTMGTALAQADSKKTVEVSCTALQQIAKHVPVKKLPVAFVPKKRTQREY